MIIVKDNSDYNDLLAKCNGKSMFVEIIQKNLHKHTVSDECVCVFVKIHNGETHVINFLHNDCKKISGSHNLYQLIESISIKSKYIFVCDKKRFIHLCGIKSVEDLLIYEFDLGVEKTSDEQFESDYEKLNKHRLYDKQNYYLIIPIVKLKQSFEKKYEFYSKYIDTFTSCESYRGLNGVITETLADVEKNGMHINNIDEFKFYFPDKKEIPHKEFVYTEYNMLTSTGRPSNRFNGINYAALPKESGCRQVFNSRFGNNGMLIMMDYSAYHPRIISNLINFPIELNVNIYDYLGRYYFSIDRNCTKEELQKSKQLTFVNLYGGIKEEYIHIPYFMKTFEYIEHRWKFFNDNGYIETPIFKRRIQTKHVSNATPNKLFNYILQAAETEFSIKNINIVNNFLRDKQTKIILYTYDSILIDAHKNDGLSTIKEISLILQDNKFPVKCYVGIDYHNMTLIDL